MSDFEWQPAYNFVVGYQPRVNSAPFGDGYEQRTADGINNNLRTWQLVFTKKSEEVNAIDQFLRQKNASDSFTWTIEGEEVRVLCRQWNKETMAPLVKKLTCTFEEVPL